jgi:hypothetical protein
MVVTNSGLTPLANIQVFDPYFGGLVCTIASLEPGEQDATSCLGNYVIDAVELKNRTNPQPLDATEGIWWNDTAGRAYFNLAASVIASPEYQNPPTSANPDGGGWLFPEPSAGAFQSHNFATIAIPIITPGDLGGWLELPFTGYFPLGGAEAGSSQGSPGLDWLVLVFELALVVGVGCTVLRAKRSAS